MSDLLSKLQAHQPLSPRETLALGQLSQSLKAKDRLLLARRALDMGENFTAYDIAERTTDSPGSISLQRTQIMALSLARSGSIKRAAELLHAIPESEDTELVGLKSRILKDLAIANDAPDAKRELFRQAGQLSLSIFRKKHRFYNGINAAACLLMAGYKDQAQQLIREEVLPLCLEQAAALASAADTDLWLNATLGECFLLLEDHCSALPYYSKATELALSNRQMGSLSSTVKQIKMLQDKLGTVVEQMLHELKLPSIAIFSGHMIDRPDRAVPRFPAYAEEGVRQELREIIRQKRIRLAYCSCACGGDIIFMEEVLSFGGTCYILPPLPIEKTIKNSVDYLPNSDWKERLMRILDHPEVILGEPECDEIGENDDLVYDFVNKFLLGAAIIKANELYFALNGVAVWDGKDSGLAGGTASAIALWKQGGIPVEVVTPKVNANG